MEFIQQFLKNINSEIHNKTNEKFFEEDLFCNWQHNSESKLHSRMLPLIIHCCIQLGYFVECERWFSFRVKDRKEKFRPDILLYESTERNQFALIEYESTNSSDARYYKFDRGTSDLKYLKKFLESKTQTYLKHWIIIITLPDKEIESHKCYSYEMGKRNEEFRRLLTSPYNFYINRYIEETDNVLVNFTHQRPTIHLLNIDCGILKLVRSWE